MLFEVFEEPFMPSTGDGNYDSLNWGAPGAFSHIVNAQAAAGRAGTLPFHEQSDASTSRRALALAVTI